MNTKKHILMYIFNVRKLQEIMCVNVLFFSLALIVGHKGLVNANKFVLIKLVITIISNLFYNFYIKIWQKTTCIPINYINKKI